MDLRAPFASAPADSETAAGEEVDLQGEFEALAPTQTPMRRIPVPEQYPEAYPDEPPDEPAPRIGVWLAVIAGAAILGGGLALLLRRSTLSDTDQALPPTKPAITAQAQPTAGPVQVPGTSRPTAGPTAVPTADASAPAASALPSTPAPP
jgi:hypothetical protein